VVQGHERIEELEKNVSARFEQDHPVLILAGLCNGAQGMNPFLDSGYVAVK